MRHRRRIVSVLIAGALLGIPAAATAQFPAASTQPAATSLPTNQPIPRDQLQRMYQRELGRLYVAADADRYLRADELLEQFFSGGQDRHELAAAIDTIGLDPDIVGRLARIRMNWPDLAGGAYYINERFGPHDVRYFLGVPKSYDRTKPWPLVVKLPTADAFVTDPRPDPIQVSQIYTDWMTQELAKRPDAVVLMPLLNLDELWGPSYAGMNYVIQPMLHAGNRVNIDPARVYLVGHSMSAHAAWNIALHYPTYFASFESLAGGASADWQRLRLMNLRDILPVMWHDADDQLIKVDAGRQLARILKNNLKCDVDYLETKGIGHVPTEAIADERYQKMRAYTRPLYPKRVSLQSSRPDTMFNRNDWVQAYQPLNAGQEKKLFFARGTGHMLLYSAAWTVDATIDQPNHITAITTNVESIRLYLNDQMVDFSKPITVVVNHKQRFEGVVKPTIDTMLKDQLFLGRGCRYYTGTIDIDFGADRPTSLPSTRRSTTQPAH